MVEVNVLGTTYTIIKGAKRHEHPVLEQASGYIDVTTKEIVIEESVPDAYTMKDLDFYEKKVIRHELVHAFLYESGLDINSDWAREEEIVDWIAIQVPKLSKMFEEIEVLN